MYARLLLFVLILLPACGQSDDLTDYLGPRPGKVYVYKASSDGQPGPKVTLETRALEWGDDSVLVEETMLVDPPLALGGMELSKSVRQFRYLVRDGRLLVAAGGEESIHLRPSLIGGHWVKQSEQMQVSLDEDHNEIGRSERKTIKIPCYMNPPSQEMVLGQNRRVLSASCRTEHKPEPGDDWEPYSVTTTMSFAQGIGHVRTDFDGRLGSQLVEIRDEQ